MRIFQLIPALTALLTFPAFSAEVPELPTPKGNQFAVELFKIETPHPFNMNSFSQNPASIERMFKSAENTVSSQPVMYAKLGAMVENDQTQKVMFPEDFNVVGGKIVPIQKLHHLGARTRVTVREVTSQTATVHIDFHHQVLKRHDKHTLGNGAEVELPIFEIRKVNTEITQKLNSWVVVGGIESKEEDQIRTAYYIIRVSRPGRSRSY